VKITARSKGRGFAGAMKRWNFGGGPAAHGSKFHRAPGSVGNRTWPGRVIPGKRLPGHFGDETVSVRNVKIVDVLPEQNALLVKGPVPGGRNTFVKITKQV
jgi:large subunit ribosomal protein L3